MDRLEFTNRFSAEYISSRTNPKTIMFSKLQSPKARHEERLFLAEGVKLSLEALSYSECEYVVFEESFAVRCGISEEIAARANELGVRVILMSDSAFEKVSTEKSPQGVIAVVKYMDKLHVSDVFSEWQKGRRIIMLDEIRDPGNLGTIIRSAEAMGYNGIILAGCADIYNPKTIRAAMGGIFRLPAFVTNNGAECVRIMNNSGRRTLAAALGEHTMKLGEYEIADLDCIVIGNEGHGISSDVLAECTACVKIPMSGLAESLNASVAASFFMWEYSRQK